MEQYIFRCANPECGRSYSYVGYKTGLGKSEAQLKQMANEAHVCRECGYDDRENPEGPKNDRSLDWGDNPYTESTRHAAGMIADLLTSGVKKKESSS